MKKRLLLFLILICASFVLTGCVDVGNFELTEEQESEIVDYSSTLLLKYNKNTSSRIVDTSAKRLLMARVEEYKKNLSNATKEQGIADGNEGEASDGKDGGVSSENAAVGEQNIARALHLPDGIEIVYAGRESCSSYPYDGSSDGFFAMDATMGNELVVFHFDIINTSDSDKECNILDVGPMYRMIINDNDRQNALTTLLLDDMATINETIEAGGGRNAVVILEQPSGYSEGISNVKFLIKVGDEQSIIPIE